MAMAPRRSMSGPVITAARTQRMFSRSSLFAASPNLRISKSSMPNALTTRLPLTVSCRIWLKSPRHVWLFSADRRILRPNLLIGHATKAARQRSPAPFSN